MNKFLKENWFKVVMASAILLVSVFLSYYLWFLSKNHNANNKALESNKISEPVISQSNNNTTNIEESIRQSLLSGALLREYQKVPDTKTDSYLGIYILNYNIAPLEENRNDNFYYSSCPEEVMGQSATGEYHLFLFQDGRIINDVLIPSYADSYDPTAGNIMELAFNNTKENDAIYYEGQKPNENEKYDIEKTQLIHFHDYNGDNLAHEFLLVGGSIACGHAYYLVAGFDEASSKAVVYDIKLKEGNIVSWYDNFTPERTGNVKVVWTCGDHGSNTETIQFFNFDDKANNYALSYDTENKCTY